jgi:hypothetical protein
VSRHVYPGSAMIGDYLRAAAGLVPIALILAFARVGAVAAAILAGLVLLFAVFGLRTALRHRSRIDMTENELRASGLLGATIRWTDLDSVKLAYYSTRRDRRNGWMQLELRAGPSVIRIDSRIGGFDQLVRRSALAASARHLVLNPVTVANLGALGIGYPDFYAAGEAHGATA